MPEPLDYAPPAERPRSRLLAIASASTYAYPFLFLAVLYGEWLLVWSVLEHRHRMALNDPKYIAGSAWKHGWTNLVIAAAPYALIPQLVLNALHFSVN